MNLNAHMDMVWHGIYSVQSAFFLFAYPEDVCVEIFWLYRFCPWIAHTNLLAKYHRATVQEERQVTYTPKFGSEAFHL